MKQDLVLGAVGGYNWEQVQIWALSLRTSGYTGVAAVIVYDNNQDVINNLQALGIQAIVMPLRGTVFNQRFFDFHEVIRDSVDNLRYVVVTDVRDVYFQSDPTVWLKDNLKKSFIASSEGLKFKDESWNFNNLQNGFPDMVGRLEDKCVYNVGVLSGKASAISDLCLAIGMAAKSTGFQVADQSGYNILLDMEPYKAVAQLTDSEEGYACQAGTFADPSKIAMFRPNLLEAEPKLDGQDVKTNGGLTYPIVHQYDRVPEWNVALRTKLAAKL